VPPVDTAKLVEQLAVIVKDSGSPGVFDHVAWISGWLNALVEDRLGLWSSMSLFRPSDPSVGMVMHDGSDARCHLVASCTATPKRKQ